MNLKIRGLLVAASLLTLATGANAGVLAPSFTASSSSLTAGDEGTLNLQFALSADSGSGFYNPTFTGGDVTINFGDGRSNTLAIGSGGAARMYGFSFLYDTVGSYSPSYSISLDYTQNIDKQEVIGQQATGFNKQGKPNKWVDVYGTVTHTQSFSSSLAGSLDLSILARAVIAPPVVNGPVTSNPAEGTASLDPSAVPVSTDTQAVPGPIAGAGLPALMALGGFVWARRRKTAAA